MKKTLITIAAICLLGAAHAKDLGVQGNVWPILERDIRQMMLESALKADWSEVQQTVKKSAETYLEKLAKRGFPQSPVTVTEWIDPSIELTSDIQAPVRQADGSLAWKVLAAKGTRVNPLAQVRPVTAMLFFDGADESQLAMVKEVLAREPNRIVVIEAGGGDMAKDGEQLQRPVFYAGDALIQRFKLKYLPTLVYPGAGAHELAIGVTSFAIPYKSNEVLLSWPDLNLTGTSPQPGAGTK